MQASSARPVCCRVRRCGVRWRVMPGDLTNAPGRAWPVPPARGLRHERRWITPALQSPLIVSANAVIAVAHAADEWLDPGLGQAFGVTDAHILRDRKSTRLNSSH